MREKQKKLVTGYCICNMPEGFSMSSAAIVALQGYPALCIMAAELPRMG